MSADTVRGEAALPLTVTCLSCGIKLIVLDHAPGRARKCPKCGRSITIRRHSSRLSPYAITTPENKPRSSAIFSWFPIQEVQKPLPPAKLRRKLPTTEEDPELYETAFPPATTYWAAGILLALTAASLIGAFAWKAGLRMARVQAEAIHVQEDQERVHQASMGVERLLGSAQAAIERKDTDLAKQQLQNYLNDPHAAKSELAKQLLTEIDLATSEASAIQVLNRLPDNELQRFATRGELSQLNAIQSPRLREVYAATLRRNLAREQEWRAENCWRKEAEGRLAALEAERQEQLQEYQAQAAALQRTYADADNPPRGLTPEQKASLSFRMQFNAAIAEENRIIGFYARELQGRVKQWDLLSARAAATHLSKDTIAASKRKVVCKAFAATALLDLETFRSKVARFVSQESARNSPLAAVWKALYREVDVRLLLWQRECADFTGRRAANVGSVKRLGDALVEAVQVLEEELHRVDQHASLR